MEARPHPQRCPAKNHLSEIGQPRLLYYNVSGCYAILPRFVPADPWKEMEMIENCQNKADFLGASHCHITTYDKKSEVPRGL